MATQKALREKSGGVEPSPVGLTPTHTLVGAKPTSRTNLEGLYPVLVQLFASRGLPGLRHGELLSKVLKVHRTAEVLDKASDEAPFNLAPRDGALDDHRSTQLARHTYHRNDRLASRSDDGVTLQRCPRRARRARCFLRSPARCGSPPFHREPGTEGGEAAEYNPGGRRSKRAVPAEEENVMGPGHHPNSSVPVPELVFETLMAYQRTAALRAAIELDVFRAVGEGPGDVAAIARRCSASERGVRILCDYLTVIGLLVKEDGRYAHTPTSALFLDPRSPACIASVARFLGNPALHEPFQRLADCVRKGRTVLEGAGTVEPENPIWVDFAHSMAPMMAPMAAPLGAIVLDGHAGPMLVLDIAAGHGLFGIEVAKQNPDARIVAVDWAPVLEVAQDNARKAGVDSRYHLLPGSASTSPMADRTMSPC